MVPMSSSYWRCTLPTESKGGAEELGNIGSIRVHFPGSSFCKEADKVPKLKTGFQS